MKIFSIGIISVILTLVVTIFAYATNYETVEPTSDLIETLPIDPVSEPIPAVEPIIEYVSLGEFRITAYCPCRKCCGEWADTRVNGMVVGASGAELIPNYSIAVDPDVIPLGSTVYIDGIAYIAHDTGGAIKGDRIDLYMNSHDDALEWGIQYHEIFVKESR